MADDSTPSTHGGLAVMFGITTFIFAGTSVFTFFMWRKEQQKNIATNQASQAAGTQSPGGTQTPGGSGTTTTTPGMTATSTTGTPKTK